jgi:tetratricopeptide (TPR) repeat protein
LLNRGGRSVTLDLVILSLADGRVVDLGACPAEDDACGRLDELVEGYNVRPRNDLLRDIVEGLCTRARHRIESDSAGAIADLSTALELISYIDRPDLVAKLHGLRAWARASTGNHQAALGDYDAALEWAPSHSTYRNNRSVCRRLTGDVRGSVDDARMAVAEDRHSGLYWLTLAEAYAAGGYDVDAVTAVRRALQLNPSLSRELGDPALDGLRARDDFPH